MVYFLPKENEVLYVPIFSPEFKEAMKKTVVRRDDSGKMKKMKVKDYSAKGKAKQMSPADRRALGRKVSKAKKRTSTADKKKAAKKQKKSMTRRKQLGLKNKS